MITQQNMKTENEGIKGHMQPNFGTQFLDDFR